MDTATGPFQATATDPYVHTRSKGLEKIHPQAFSSMAYHGHQVSGIEGQTPTKFLIKTECINDESDSRTHCKGTGNIQIVLSRPVPLLFLAQFKHDEGCKFKSVTLEDSACDDKTFPTNYFNYLSDAAKLVSTHTKITREAREEELKLARIKGHDVTCSHAPSIQASNLQTEVLALCNQVIDYYIGPQPESFWKI